VTSVLLVGLSALLVVACGVFVAAEFALVTVSRPGVERAAAQGLPGARGVHTTLKSLSTHLSSAQIGITLTNLAIGWLAEPAVARLVDGPLARLGVPDSMVTGVSLTLAVVGVTVVTMLFGELVPKNLALAHPFAVARVVQLPQRAFTAATRPLTVGLNTVANHIVRSLGVEPQEELASARTPEELVSVLRNSAESGVLPPTTATLVERVLRFDDKRARDVLTPRTRVVWVHAADPVQRVVDLAREHGVSRFPVAGADLDDVVGVVELTDAVAVPVAERSSTPVGRLARPALFLPHTTPLDEVLWALRDHGTELCVVVDEYGGTAGIATFEDVVEEIVGEVADEHDAPQVTFRRDGDGWIVSGLLRPDEVHAKTGLRLPEAHARYETVAGFVMHVLGQVPRVGDSAEVDGLRVTVERLDGRRVDLVRIERVAVDDGEGAGDE
jgi:CBS domain containing-hemolysin-like protein